MLKTKTSYRDVLMLVWDTDFAVLTLTTVNKLVCLHVSRPPRLFPRLRGPIKIVSNVLVVFVARSACAMLVAQAGHTVLNSCIAGMARQLFVLRCERQCQAAL